MLMSYIDVFEVLELVSWAVIYELASLFACVLSAVESHSVSDRDFMLLDQYFLHRSRICDFWF